MIEVIELNGTRFFVYAIGHVHGQAVGFDPRPLAAVEAEWIEKAKKAGLRRREVMAELAKANIANGRVAERDAAFDHEDDDVKAPPAFFPVEPELFRLTGLPGGYGTVTLPADNIHSISGAVGELFASMIAGLIEAERAVQALGEMGRDAQRQAVRAARALAGSSRAGSGRRGKKRRAGFEDGGR